MNSVFALVVILEVCFAATYTYTQYAQATVNMLDDPDVTYSNCNSLSVTF